MKKLEELKKLLIVVDMVNGFVKEGNMADPYIMHTVDPQIRIISMIQKEREGLAFIKDTHKLNCREFQRYPKHCVEGTKEAELIDELKMFEKEAFVYLKNSTSTIFAPYFLEDIDRMKALREVIITGCCTDICVLNLAIPLQNYFDQMDRKIDIILPQDAIETYQAPGHDRKEYNEISYQLLEQSGLKLVKAYKGGESYGK